MGRCDHALGALRRVHDGVYATGHAPLTPAQRRWAATLTAPRTVLAYVSGGCFWDLRDREPRAPTVVRPGHTGPNRRPDLVVRYSATLSGNVVCRDGLWVTTPERTLIDLWPTVHGRARDRMLRDAIRLHHTTHRELGRVLFGHRGRRGTASLRATCALYERLPLSRCRSDAEVEGLVVLDAVAVEIPRVNARIAGEEADFSWPDRKLIIEIDGPQFHRDPLEDARKTRIWIAAGYTVRRISSDDVYASPERLVALATA